MDAEVIEAVIVVEDPKKIGVQCPDCREWRTVTKKHFFHQKPKRSRL